MKDEIKLIPNILAIDFGTSRTKAATWNPGKSEVEIFPIGDDEKQYIPSLFHIDADGEIYFGEAASDLLIHDPLGALDNIKLHLDRFHRAANGKGIESVDLLKVIFQHIFKKYTANLSVYRKGHPVHLVLTLPSRWHYEDIYRDAITAAGISFEQISFVKEPVAAAFYWKMQEQNSFTGPLVVIDVGGGTVDWACVLVEKQKLGIIPECPPSGLEGAGLNVDRSIFSALENEVEQLEGDRKTSTIAYLKEHKSLLLDYIRKIKERGLSIDQTRITFSIAGHKIILGKSAIQGVLKGPEAARIIDKSCDYLAKAYQVVNQPLTCVIVGGGSRLPSFKAQLSSKVNKMESERGVKVVIMKAGKLNYATVLGATHYHMKKNGLSSNLSSNGVGQGSQSPSLLKPGPDISPVKDFFDRDKI